MTLTSSARRLEERTADSTWEPRKASQGSWHLSRGSKDVGVFISWNQLAFVKHAVQFRCWKEHSGDFKKDRRRKNRPIASQPPGPKWPLPVVQVSSPIHTGPLGIRVCALGQLGLSFPGILPYFLYPPSSPPMATAPHSYHPFPALRRP